MRKFTISVDIPAPPARVYEVISDVDRWHEWTPSITSVTRDSKAPLAVGSSAVVRQPKLPPAKWTVTKLEPGHGFTWVARGPGLRTIGDHWVEPIANGSRATLSVEQQGLLGGIMGRLTKRLTEQYIAFEAAGLKARCENPQYRRAGA